MRFGRKDYKVLVGMDLAVAKVGAAPGSGAGDDAETMVALLCTKPGHQGILPSPSCTSSSSAWGKTSPAML